MGNSDQVMNQIVLVNQHLSANKINMTSDTMYQIQQEKFPCKWFRLRWKQQLNVELVIEHDI